MKKYIVSVLIPCLLLQFVGCYSFQPISVVDESNLENKDIRFALSTGETVSSKAYHHTLILYPSEFIIGKGDRYFNSSNSFESFEGKVLINDIDSISFNKQQRVNTVRLKSKDRIRLVEGDYFVVTNKTENGFWFWDKNISRKVDPSTISSIEADKINIVNTSLLVGSSVLIIAIIVLASTFHLNGPLLGGGGSF
jgi:hypothetical protein